MPNTILGNNRKQVDPGPFGVKNGYGVDSDQQQTPQATRLDTKIVHVFERKCPGYT